MVANLYEIAAIAAATRGLRTLPGADALLLEIYADIGNTVAPGLLVVGTQPSWSLSGSGQPFQLDGKIASVSAGTALGQATYQLSVNGGAYSAAANTLAGPTAIPGAPGWSLTMAAGTYSTAMAWHSGTSAIANYAASNLVEPACAAYGVSIKYPGNNGLPAWNMDPTIGPPGGALGGVIQSTSCTATTATVNAPYTAIWTCKYSSTASNYWDMGNPGASDGTTFAYANNMGASYLRRAGSTALQTVVLAAVDANWHVYASRYTGTQVDFWVDGTQVSGYQTIISTGGGVMSNANLLQIGRRYDSAPYNCDFQSFAMYSRALTPYEMAVCSRAVQRRLRFI